MKATERKEIETALNFFYILHKLSMDIIFLEEGVFSWEKPTVTQENGHCIFQKQWEMSHRVNFPEKNGPKTGFDNPEGNVL